MPDAQHLALLDAGTRRLVRTVDALDDEQWPQPSLLPGWSRAHVVAHLLLNAEALAGALEAARQDGARLGAAGRRRAEERFAVDAMTEGYEEALGL